jgi:uncharacterized membrane protein YfcA
MLLSPKFLAVHKGERRRAAAAVGFAGGLIAGFTAMPGAAPTIWCNLRGISKDEQRGLVQPYIAVMQCIGIVLLLTSGGFNSGTFFDFLVSLPALAAGTALGIFLFAKISHVWYRRTVLSILLAGGVVLMF